MTFSDFLIQEKGENFYFNSLNQMIKNRITLENWFNESYKDYKLYISSFK